MVGYPVSNSHLSNSSSSGCAGLGNQSCDVVLVKGALAWENHKGSGLLNGKQMGNRWRADGEGWK
jgi:hypothetical protein